MREHDWARKARHLGMPKPPSGSADFLAATSASNCVPPAPSTFHLSSNLYQSRPQDKKAKKKLKQGIKQLRRTIAAIYMPGLQ